MKAVPSYTKVLTLGSSYTENALSGPVVIQEKLDGSQFSFGFNEDGDLVMRSKSVALFEFNHADMFKEAVKRAIELAPKFSEWFEKEYGQKPKDLFFYGEYLQKPKHNTLKYERVPNGNIALFDVLMQGQWLGRDMLEKFASILGVDAIPQIYVGDADTDLVKALLTQQSYLGNEIIEGVVIKNYNQTILLGGNVFPLFTKFVREEFKERHETDWKIRQPKGGLTEYIAGFHTEARWDKARQYLRDQGLLEGQPRDIEKLMGRVKQDIGEEETENIKRELFKMFIDDIMRSATKGLPEWYKNKLLENVK